MTTETVYKVLNADRSSCNGGSAVWVPGEWMPEIEGPLKPCANGYHLCRRAGLVRWLGPAIWVAEYDGEWVYGDDKIVVRRARIIQQLAWNDRLARLFACDCAERVLPIAERYTDDRRLRQAIEVARRFADRQATAQDLAATSLAARYAALYVAWGAVWYAAREWQTSRLFDYLEGRVR